MVSLSKYDLARRKFDEEICRIESDRIRIADLVSEHGSDIYLVVEDNSYYSNCDVTVKIVREREEDDEAYAGRISVLREQKAKAAAARKRAKEREAEKDRDLFEKLKSKYDW